MRIEPGKQRGAALLIAILAAALAAVMAVALVERSQRDLARTSALFAAERSWQLAGGLEGLARDWIRKQRDAGLADDSLDGRWAAPMPVPGGVVRARVFDLGGRFNLNRLAHRDPETAAHARRALLQLLAHVNLEAELGAQIIALYADNGHGAATGLTHVSELNRLERFTPANRSVLEPYLTVLPDPDSRINLNRAAPEVVAAMIEGLDPQSARTLLARRPFADMDAVAAQPELERLARPLLAARFGVASDWFLAQAEVTLAGETRNYFRLLGTASSGYDFRYFSQGIP